MKIEQITVWPLQLTLRTPFMTAHGTTSLRPLQLIELKMASGDCGYGEVQAFADQAYAKQDQRSARQELAKVLPRLVGQTVNQPDEFQKGLNGLTAFAKAAVEMALWDAYGKVKQQSLAQLLAVSQLSVPVSAAIGIQTQQVRALNQVIRQGYQRVKIKAVDPQTALTLIKAVKQHYPHQMVSLDANAAWPNQPATVSWLRAMEKAGLALIEEPVHDTTLHEFHQLQGQFQQLKISLDESLTNLRSVEEALQVDAAAAYTLKQGKLGGVTDTLKAITAILQANRLPFIGGMLASGLGRSLDLVLAAKAGYPPFPADVGASDHYFEKDIIKERLTIHDGRMNLPTEPGLGVTIDWTNVANLQVGPSSTFS